MSFNSLSLNNQRSIATLCYNNYIYLNKKANLKNPKFTNNITVEQDATINGSVVANNVNSVTANIGTANITTDNIGTANIDTTNITTDNIVTANIGTANIGTANITTDNIGTANVGTANIDTANVTNAVFTHFPTVFGSDSAITSSNQLVNKSYVDATSSGLKIHESVSVASTSNIDLSSTSITVIDGYTLVNGDRVLIKDQTTASQNGVYDYTVSGSNRTFARSSDMSTGTNAFGFAFAVVNGDSASKNTYVVTGTSSTSNSVLVDTDNVKLTFFNSFDYHLGNTLVNNAGYLNVNPDLEITTLHVSSTTTLASTSATSLTVSGATTLGSTSVTSLHASGATTLASTSASSLTVSGATALASTTASSLTVSGPVIANNLDNLIYYPGMILAWWLDGASKKYNYYPILCSQNQVSADNTSDYIILLPGVKVDAWINSNYSGTQYTYDNTNGTTVSCVPTVANTISSCIVYYKGAEININYIS